VIYAQEGPSWPSGWQSKGDFDGWTAKEEGGQRGTSSRELAKTAARLDAVLRRSSVLVNDARFDLPD